MQNLFRLANIVGLDTDNTQHSVALKEAMHGVVDQDAFIDYCRDHKAKIITYGKHEKPERLDTLATAFKQIQEDARLESSYTQAELYGKQVAGLVEQCRNFVEDNYIDFKNVKGQFKDHQIRCLESIGSTAMIIEYSRTNKLASEVCKAYVATLKPAKSYEQLGSPDSQKILRLAKKALK